MDSVVSALGWTAAVVFGYMTAWFVVAMLAGRNDIVDVAWGLGYIVIGWSLLLRGPATPRLLLVTGLATLWGLRLAYYVYLRNRGKAEDFRYKKWREDWGRWFVVRTFLQVFMLQGFFMVLISAPIWVISAAGCADVDVCTVAGIAVWAVGLGFEAVGDAQMRTFKSDPANKGRLIDVGLWRYTRHPNYFGEIVVWLGAAVVALPVANGWLALLGPLTIGFVLIRISGPMLERKYEGRDDWEAYKAKTSMFIPLPPKR